MADKKTPATRKPAAKRQPVAAQPRTVKKATKPPAPKVTTNQKLLRLRKEMAAAREDINAANRTLARIQSELKLSGIDNGELEALGRVGEARASYHIARKAFDDQKAKG